MSSGFIAVYGTLRKGHGLSRYLSNEFAEYLGTAKIKGFKMYVFSPDHWSYPVLTRTDKKSDVAVVELYKVHDNMSGQMAENNIDAIEYGAGYFSEKVKIKGNDYKIYLQNDDDMGRMFHVKSGDFNEYSREYGR